MHSQELQTLTIQASVNTEGFLKQAEKFFSSQNWLSELFQNAYRANASHISVSAQEKDLVIEDNGEGITSKESWLALLTIAQSNWGEKIKTEQHPAGMGLFSLLLTHPLTIESRGAKLQTTPQQIKGQEKLKLESTSQQTTRIKIHGGVASLGELYFRAGLLQQKIGCFFFTQKGEDMKVTVAIGNEKCDFNGRLMDAPWARSNILPQNCLPFDKPIYTLDKDLTSQVHYEAKPGIITDRGNYLIYCVSAPKRSYLMHICAHGLQIEHSFLNSANKAEEEVQKFLAGQAVVLLVKQQSPINFKLPDRTEVLRDTAWEAFLQNEVIAHLKERIRHNEEITGRFLSGVLPLGLFGKSQVTSREFYTPALAEHTGATNSAQRPELLFQNEWVMDCQTKSKHNAHPFVPLKQAGEDFTFTQNGLLATRPKLYDELDLIISNDIQIDWNTAVEAITPKGTPYTEDCNGQLALANTARILEKLAREGQLLLGTTHPGMPTNTKGKGEYDNDKIRTPLDLAPVLGKEHSKLVLPNANGGHTIVFHEIIGLHDTEAKRNWTLISPFITMCFTEQSSWSACGNQTFIANLEFKQLMVEDPKKAYQLFYAAAQDSYSYNDESEEVFDSDTFDLETNFTDAEAFFIRPKAEEILGHALRKLVLTEHPQFDELLHNHSTILHLKQLTYKKGVVLDAALTFENPKEVLKAECENNHWTVTHTPRKRGFNQKAPFSTRNNQSKNQKVS